jgi:hypothetical protein
MHFSDFIREKVTVAKGYMKAILLASFILAALPFTAQAAEFTITATADANGSISPAGMVVLTEGTDQSFDITPSSGYEVTSLLIDGISVATTTTFTFSNVQADHTIEVFFDVIPPITHTITAIFGSNGAIDP